MFYFFRQAGLIYRMLEGIEKKSKQAKTKAELEECWKELSKAEKILFHRHMYAEKNRIAAYIQGRHESTPS
jgi:hypothetical protein